MAKRRGGAPAVPAPPSPTPAPAVAIEEQAPWRPSDFPTRWLLALLVEVVDHGPARVRATAGQVLARITVQLEARRRAAARRGQLQLDGVIGAPVYPPSPRWRARRQAPARGGVAA